MKAIRLVAGLAVVAVIAAFAVNVSLAGEGEYTEEQMQAWMKAISPGDHHKQLKMLVGTWDAKVMMWMAPGTDPQVTMGKSTNEMVLGGRFVVQKFEGEMMGMPFEGMGMFGFDKTIGKHTSVWVDNMGTQTMYTEGDCSDHCMKEVHNTTMKDPMGNEMKVRMVTVIVDENKHTMEMFMITPDGGEFKSMEIVYTRG